MGRKPTEDPNLFAKRVFDKLLDKLDPEAAAERQEPEPKGKNRKAQSARRKGGKRGGPARAAKLSPTERKQIAKKAAAVRWKHRS